jgi:hypothetical protein
MALALVALLGLLVATVVVGYASYGMEGSGWDPCLLGGGGPMLQVLLVIDLVGGVLILRAGGWRGWRTVPAVVVAVVGACIAGFALALPGLACLGA